ncbi:SpoIIE family protein phosphatase [Streptomyces sp. NPDC087917]|uniref:SpoIIE family protein phosphatase n=1 Tax=Streptomyces sp. NPDC087917 TaxID=3155060 RepID=UPI00343516CF
MDAAGRGSEPGPGAGLPDALLSDVVRDTGASVGLVYLRSPEEQVLRLTMVSGVSRRIAAPWARIPMDAEIPVADAMRRRRLVWLGSQEEVARRYPRLGIVLPYDFMLAAAPIADAATAWGGIVLLWPVWHPPQLSAAERDTVTACCRRAADLLRRTTAGGHALRLPAEPTLLPAAHPREADPTQATAALRFTERLPVGCCALDLDGRLTFINPAGVELVGASAAALLGHRPWEVLLWLHDPLFEDRYRAAVVSRQPTSFTARRPPDRLLSFRLYPDNTGISVHITPSAQAHGARARTSDPPGAEPVGAAALYQLTHLATVLAEAVGVRDVIELAADQIVPGFGPQGLVVMTAREGRLRILGHRGYRQEFIDRFDGEPVGSGRTPAQVMATGRPVFFANHEEFRRAHPSAPRYENRDAWAFLPLTASGRHVGSLTLSYDRPRSFSPAERALLTSIAGLIAQALDRARLYDATHALAHTLQNSLLPRTLPRVAGLQVCARYRPAGHGMDIGGDFYDLIARTPTTATAAIGDVQGHNTTAAALMGQLRTAVHAHATAGASPGDILSRTNRLLIDLDPGLFASCLIAHLDLSNHRALLATAGHPPALLRHPDGRTGPLSLPPGLLLGIDPAAEYLTVEVPLPFGAVLALYTDGLVETPGIDIDDSTAALARHLAARGAGDLDAVADALIDRAERSAPRYDDIALLLLRPHDGP